MTKIALYPTTLPELTDMLIGTDVNNNNATKNFTVGDVVDLATGGGGGPGIFGSTYFVAPEGDDATGTVGTLSKPWKTISAARDQAVEDGLHSSLIFVYPGEYNEAEIQYPNGQLYLSPGALIVPPPQINGQLTAGVTAINQVLKKFRFNGNWAAYLEVGSRFIVNEGGLNQIPFTIVTVEDDGAETVIEVLEDIPSPLLLGYLRNTAAVIALGVIPLNAPVTSSSEKFSVFGEGDINVLESVDNNWAGGIVRSEGTSEFYGEAVSWRQEQGVMLTALDSSKLVFNGSLMEIYGAGGYICTARDTSQTTFNFDRIKNSGSWTFYCRGGNTPSFSGTCVVTANRITQTGAFQVYAVQDMVDGANVVVNCPIVECENYIVNFNDISGGSYIVNGNLFSTTATGNGLIGQNMSGGSITINGNITTETGRAILTLGGMTGGDIRLNGELSCPSGNDIDLVEITGTGTNYYLDGSITNTNGGTCVGITKKGGNLVIGNLKILCDGDSIDATTPQDINVIHSLAANTALDANITNIVTGSNVIIDANVI